MIQSYIERITGVGILVLTILYAIGWGLGFLPHSVWYTYSGVVVAASLASFISGCIFMIGRKHQEFIVRLRTGRPPHAKFKATR